MMKNRSMKVSFCAAFILLAGFHATALAQAVDAERASRIRQQIRQPAEGSRFEESALLRDDMRAAIASLLTRLDSLESEIIDLKARIKAVEMRAPMPAQPSEPKGAIDPRQGSKQR